MAVIKCSNCENEILDSEIVCPYCDCPVSITKDKLERSSDLSHSDDADNSGTMKVASPEDFEKEKAALMTKLADEEKTLNGGVEADGQTVKISRDKFRDGRERDTDRFPSRDVKSKASRISISTPGDSGKSDSTRRRSSEKNKKTKEKGKKLILVVTFIGVLLIVYLIYALFSSIQNSMPSLKKKENKTSVVSSDAEVVDKGYKFTSSSTLVITSNDVMDDYDSSSSAPWSEKAEQIKHITIEDSVDRIGDYSFAHFTALEDVVLGKSVAEIGKEAFYGCESLERVTCRSDSKLRTIGDNAFTNCSSLESFKLGKSIKSIGEGAFKSCNSLEEIEIPANVKIGDDAFLGCSSDFTIVCKKNSSAHEYADRYGHKVEFTDKDKEAEPDDTDADDVLYENTGSTTSSNDTTKKEEKKSETKDTKKDDKKDNTKEDTKSSDKDTNKKKDDTTSGTTTKDDQTTTSKPSQESGTSGSKSQTDIMKEIKDINEKIKDPSISASQKAAYEAERDSLDKALENYGQ